ncbi:hypothetical protein ES703_19655 [subsurface metagenome]
MAQEFALVTPTTEEMTRVGIVAGTAGVAGAVEGIALTMAPKLGALELPFTWGTLLGVPVIGAGIALMTKGMISDAGLGMAAGGAALLGQTLPVMLQEFTLAKAPRPGGGGLLGAGNAGTKLLGAGRAPAAEAARRTAAGARVGLDF